MYTFYHAPGASSMAVLIGLHEVKAKFETRLIRFDQREADPPEFRALNPEGKVPTLAVDGRPLTEVAGILWYLARRHPEAALLPVGDAEAEARVVSWMSFIASAVHPARRLGAAQAQASVQDRGPASRRRALGGGELFYRRHPLVSAVLAFPRLAGRRSGELPASDRTL